MNVRQNPRRLWGVIGVVVVCSLGLGVLAWPGASRWMAGWTGEEEPLAQLKGMLNLVDIRLHEPPLTLDADRPMPYTNRRPYCASTFLEQEADPANVARTLDLAKAAGVSLVRQQFPWEDIEIHGKGDFEDRRHEPYRSAWEKYDRILDMAEARGIDLIARLDAPPDWARANPAEHDLFGPPDNLDDYGDFVAAVVSRYKGRLKYLQIWNEPNIYPEWGAQSPDPEAYTRLLEVAYRRAKAIDPDIAIISAPLAPTLDRNERAMRDLDYLQRMLDAGAADSFDILGMIAYGLGSGPDDHRVVWHRTNFARPQLLRDLLVRAGHGDKPAWILEMGWSAVPEGMPAPFGRVSEEQQASYTVGAYRRIEDDYSWVGAGCLWYLRRPNDEWETRPEGYFRLVTPDWKPMPAYTALAAEATAPPTLPSGFRHISHPAFSLTGPWQHETSPHALLGDWQRGGVGATLRFTLDGPNATLATRRGPTAGALEVAVDGGRPTQVNLTAPTETAADIPLALGLTDGPHTVEIRVSQDGVVVEGVTAGRATASNAAGAVGANPAAQTLSGAGREARP